MVNVGLDVLSKHKRTLKSMQRREQRNCAKRFMWENSFQDTLKAETVNCVSYPMVLNFLGQRFGEVNLNAVPCAAVEGCVLTDARGQGAFQK